MPRKPIATNTISTGRKTSHNEIIDEIHYLGNKMLSMKFAVHLIFASF